MEMMVVGYHNSKAKRSLWINCLGASTTQNTLKEKDKNEIFSYPILLEKKKV